MISKTDPHIMICIPCIDKPHLLFTQSLAQMMWQLGRWGAPTILCSWGGSVITKARNMLVEGAYKYEKDGVNVSHILWLDSDMTFPDMLLYQLLNHNKDIVGCTYVRRSAPFDVHGKTLDGIPQDVTNAGLVEMAALATGCLLVKLDVYRKLKRPYFRFVYREETETSPACEYGEDYTFCAMARAVGYKIWLDAELSKKVGHVSEKVLYPEEDSWPEHKEKMKEALNGMKPHPSHARDNSDLDRLIAHG